MKKHLFIVPRWGGTADSDWYKWLEKQLLSQENALFASIQIGDMPEPDEPRIDPWVDKIREMLGEEGPLLSQTILVGHSVGCQAILRYLAKLPPDVQVAAVLCVAGWWTVDEPWSSIRPWVETPLDPAGVRNAARSFTVLVSDNDPFTANWQVTQRLWQERLGATVRVVSDIGHFNDQVQPIILQAVIELA